MLILQPQPLEKFGRDHANARKSLATWRRTVEDADWEKSLDVLKDLPSAKMLPNKRARFEILHNVYCLIAELDYEDGILNIRFIGTHSEYDKIDAETI